MGHYHYGCDEYCDYCLPVDENHPEVVYDCGEQDHPAHCCVCHEPLDYNLTDIGINYVLDAIKESLNKPAEERNKVHECYNGTYYEGSRHVEIVRDWADNLSNYWLSEKNTDLIDKFLEETAE